MKEKKETGRGLQNDFEIFARGVERLKELEKDLNSMNTRGFSREEQEIRTHLKSVADIPLIEKKMKALQLKINHKYFPPKKKSKLSRDIQEIKQTLPNLKKSIKGDIQSLKEEVPSLRKEIQEISKKLEHKAHTPIDNSVGLLVDSDFDDFLKHLKVSLSERIHSQEKSMDARLRRDLQSQEKLFREKYAQLIQDFQKKKEKLAIDYKKKYNVDLKKEMQEKIEKDFDLKVREKIESMKSDIRNNYMKQLKDHAHAILEMKQKELRNKLQKNYSRQLAILTKEFKKKVARIQDEQKREHIRLQQHKEKLVAMYREKMEHRQSISRNMLQREMGKQEREHEAVMHLEHQKLEQEKLLLQKRFKEKMKQLHERLHHELDVMHHKEKDLYEAQLKLAQQSKQSRQHEHYIEKTYERKILSLEKEKKNLFEKEKIRLEQEHRELLEKLDLQKNQLLENLRVKKQAEIEALRAEKTRLQKLHTNYVKKSEMFEEKNTSLENARREISKEHTALLKAQQLFEQRKESVIKQIRTKLANEFHSHLEKEIAKKEALLRSELQTEYALKLKKHIQVHEEALQKRKLDIEMQLQKNLKHILR